jgi:hypothetical protein
MLPYSKDMVALYGETMLFLRPEVTSIKKEKAKAN